MVGRPWKKDAGKLGLEYQRKRVEVSDEENLREVEKHPLAWLLLTAKRAKEERV